MMHRSAESGIRLFRVANLHVSQCNINWEPACAGTRAPAALPQDMRHFRAMLRKLDNTTVKGYWPAPDLVASLEPSACPPAQRPTCSAVVAHAAVEGSELDNNVMPTQQMCP